jgi:hypothetical protein
LGHHFDGLKLLLATLFYTFVNVFSGRIERKYKILYATLFSKIFLAISGKSESQWEGAPPKGKMTFS